MAAGGYWSSQELNWGGWWNWDVLEMGSLFVWLVAAVGAHVTRGSSFRNLFAGLTASTSLSFYLLNKTGLGVSIHSFVASEVVRTNYTACAALALFMLGGQAASNACVAAACCLAYSGATSFEALKLPAAAAAAAHSPLWG